MDLSGVVVADELHYRRLLAELRRLGVDELELADKTIPELVVLKEQLLARLMHPTSGRAK